MYNLLNEPSYIQNIAEEYLKLSHFYIHNFANSQSIYCRYYHINVDKSVYIKETDIIHQYFDQSQHALYWQLFDLTPTFLSGANIYTNAYPDLKSAGNTITVYTIDKPAVNDLIVFYEPFNTNEVFRVANTTPNYTTYGKFPLVELQLEKAPFDARDFNSKLGIKERYIYMNDFNRYIEYGQANTYKTLVDKLPAICDTIASYFDYIAEFYMDRNKDSIPCTLNSLLQNLYNIVNKYALTLSYPVPFGFEHTQNNINYSDFDIIELYEKLFNSGAQTIEYYKDNTSQVIDWQLQPYSSIKELITALYLLQTNEYKRN